LTELDLSPHAAGNTGIDFVHSFESKEAGPHAMIVALIHGNEPCGAIALDYLLRKAIRPSRGRLTLCFANIEAFRIQDPEHPSVARFIDTDMNLVWQSETLRGPGDSVELRRARLLAPIVETTDYLLDLHSMQMQGGPLVLAGLHEKGRALARKLGFPAPVIVDGGHDAGTRLRDFGGFGKADDPRTALLVECGQHRDDESATVALEVALRFMRATGVVSADAVAPHLAASARPASDDRTIEVTDVITCETGAFSFALPLGALTAVKRRGTLIGHDGERPVHAPYDDCYLILPARMAGPGQTAVRLGRALA